MASIPLLKSESELQNLNDNSVIIFDVNIPSDEDFTEDTEIEVDEMSESDDCKSTNSENRSASGESANITLLSPEVHSCVSESEASPIPYRKKRPAPLPPNMSPSVATRHSYAFDQNAMRMRTSTDTESNTSESRLFYQTSTDSESLAMPESARGSNFPGELAGVDNLYAITTLRPFSNDTSQSPRGLSKLGRLREVFRSPQIGRRKTMREEKGGREKTPTMRKMKTGDGNTPLMKKSKVDESKKSPKEKPTRSFEPVPQLSDWIMAAGYDDLDIDQEFEVKRVLDYEKFLSELLEDTDNYHVDYVDISRSLIRVRSMMKEREEEISNEDDTVMETAELRSSQDHLSIDHSTLGSRNSVNSQDNSISTHDNSFSTLDNSSSTHDNSSSTHDNSSSTHDNSSSTQDNSSSTQDNSFSIVHNNNNEDSDKLSARKLSSRRKSAPSALLFKSLASMKARSPTSVWYNAGLSKKDQDVIAQFKLADGDTDRVYVTEGSVQFAAGMQVQDRYLFLFTDLLLVTKQKSNTTFKLKQKVHLCDMWIASCIEDVSELTRPIDRSFVIGWPTTNVVATFPNLETKDDWLSKFSQNITKQKIKEEHKSLQLKVIPRDIEAVTCSSCQMTVDVFTQAKDVVRECLKQANLSDSDAKDYQLWVVAGKENSPYPLIGHETPYSIKYNQARELSRSRSANDLDNMTALDLDTIVENISVSGSKCEFYLKQKQSPRNGQFEDSPHHKPMKKHKKTQNIFNTIFRKKRVFGIPLAKICDKNLDPPEGIIKLMVQVYQHGPQTSGILRRGNNALLGKEIKEKINAGDKYHLEDHMTPTAASVFKEFLRSIPEGVLVCSLHQQWLCVNKDDPYEEKINKIKTLLAKLPAENFHMLKLTICLLQHLAKHCSVNHMGPSNLATCIAPSLFVQRTNRSSHGKWKGGDVQKQMQESVSEIQEVIVPLISFIITNHIELFGEDILSMFVRYGCQASPPGTLDDRYDGQIQPSADEEEEEEDMSGEEDDDNFSAELTDQHHRVQVHPGKPTLMRDSNSGTDSDSMHSVLSMQDGGMGLHHDDSSIDSLGDRDYYSHESPKATKSHLSPSNLSRDSGLTLSDNQLYDEEAYQADIASASARMYQAKMSNPDPPDMDRCDPGKCRQTSGSQTDKYDSPIPPPRKRSMRRKACIVSSDGERQGFVEYSSQRPPLKHSASTTYLDESPSSAAHKEQRNMVPNLSSIDHRVSDLKEKVQEVTDSPVNVQTMSARTNIGTLIKSASGSRLYLNTDTRPAEFSLQPIEGAAEPPAMRHSSANGHSVPVSPESRHSHSSGDSVISSSIYSSSRDSSINSAPLTPEESSDISLSWIPDINLPGKPWDILLHGTSTAQSLTQTKSSGQSFRNETTSENSCVDTSETLNSPMSFRKSVVAEEVHISRKPHFSLMSDNSTNSSHPLSKNALSLSSIQLGKQRFSAYLDLGSPPPNVILQTLQTSALKDGAGEGALHRRSSVDLAEPRHFHFSKEMQSIIPEEYLHVRSTPVIISPEGESGVAAGATSKAKLSKYIRDKDYVLPLSKQHVDKPLNYEQVQRNFMMKYNEPDDITEKQREISARAKAMYEKSLQLYQKEEIQFSDNQASKTQSVENVTVSSNLAYVKESKPGSEIEETQSGRLGNLDSTLTAYTSQDSFHSAVMSDDLDDSGASGFLDFGSVSLSLERDIIGGHKHRAESDASLFNRSISPGNLLSISRNDSRLSDTDSSGSSTVTVSTLSQLSDSFNSHSDLSNTSSVTISSLTSSDSNPEIRSRSSNRKSARNFDQEFSPVCPRNSSSERINIEMLENEGEDEVGHYTNDIKKDPKEIYLQSKQIYEQKGPHGVSSLVSKGVSSSQDASSVSHGIKPSASSSALPVIRKSLTSHPFVNAPKLQSSPISPVPSTQKTAPVAAAFAGRPAESKARLGLDAPRVNLQRSCSDLSKHANKQGSYSSHSTTVGQDGSADVKENKQSALSTSIHSSNETQPRDVKSEYQQNFMRAKSCFHQAESIKNRHSDTVPYHPVQSPPAARLGKQHMPNPSVTAEPTAANLSAVGKSAANLSAVNLSAVKPSAVKPSGANLSAATPSAANLSSAITSAASPSALSPEATVPHSQTTDSKSQVNKKEFPWSVKVLKSKYDTDQSKDPGNSRNNNESTSQTLTHSHPQSPLPLRNPSSLRQQGSPQHSRSNRSSSSEQASSCNTSPKTSVSYRHGPQSYPCEASHYSYSSSDDSYGSSPEKRTTWLSGSSFDSEELSDYTNTTYI